MSGRVRKRYDGVTRAAKLLVDACYNLSDENLKHYATAALRRYAAREVAKERAEVIEIICSYPGTAEVALHVRARGRRRD